ncbi:LysM peptidoglycan-binding domain-containing protein [Priestia aryabhattai]|uniref:LysM domain-containing protein n=1 Tax=Priestia aryabhattai TaxID=412384 RepID=A0ABD7X329_PRIAR|nr:LysM domain-containing protein [Priestia aryabhattai]WEA46807.1 LysM domain-containing protein [Priestia aryabhattai]
MARLGKVQLLIEKESDSKSIEATSYPVEKGVAMTDHVEKKPGELSLSGYIIGPNYKADKEYLQNEMNKGTMFTYVGRNVAKNVIITSIDGDVDANIANGTAISIKLQEIRIANTPWVKVKNGGKKKPVTTKPPISPVYHLVKKGDTYWDCWKRYGTSIPQLRAWNKYPDRRIPIGVKLRVK